MLVCDILETYEEPLTVTPCDIVSFSSTLKRVCMMTVTPFDTRVKIRIYGISER